MGKYNNTLIKKSRLAVVLKKQGIKRINKKSLLRLERYLEEKILSIMPYLKEQMIINGKKTLEEKEVVDVLRQLDKINIGTFEI